MKKIRVLTLIATFLFSSMLWAEEGETIFKSRCAVCHGPNGEGKIGPALKGTKVSQGDIVALLTKGDDARKIPHKKPTSGLTEDQAKAVAQYVSSLK